MCYPYPRSKTILQGRASFLQYLSYFLILLSFYIRYLLFLKYVHVCIWVCVDLSVWTFWWLVFWEQSEFGKMTLKPWKHIFFSFLFVFAFTFSDGFAFLKMCIFCASMPRVLNTSREKLCSQADWSLYKYMDFKLGQAPRLSANS